MVICAENINSSIIASGNKLIVMIRNIRNKIRRNSVCTDKNSVLIVAQLGGSEPERPLLLISIAAFL